MREGFWANFFKKMFGGIKGITNKFLRVSKNNWEIITIVFGVSVVFVFLFWLQIKFKKVSGFTDGEFWLGALAPNIMADMIGIIITSFVIAGLFNKNQKKREEEMMYRIFGYEFEKLTELLSRNYLFLLTKDWEKFLSFSVDSKDVKDHLIGIIKNQDSCFDHSKFISDIKIWDVSTVSTIYDDCVVFIPEIEDFMNEYKNHNKETKKLLKKKAKLARELKRLDVKSAKYSYINDEYSHASMELNRHIKIVMSIDPDLLDVKVLDLFPSFIKFFNSRVQDFYDKYNFALPMDIRLIFSELEKNLTFVSQQLSYGSSFPKKAVNLEEYDANKEKIVFSIVTISKEFLILMNYFEKIK